MELAPDTGRKEAAVVAASVPSVGASNTNTIFFTAVFLDVFLMVIFKVKSSLASVLRRISGKSSNDNTGEHFRWLILKNHRC